VLLVVTGHVLAVPDDGLGLLTIECAPSHHRLFAVLIVRLISATPFLRFTFSLLSLYCFHLNGGDMKWHSQIDPRKQQFYE
jgi:hypothetical protein